MNFALTVFWGSPTQPDWPFTPLHNCWSPKEKYIVSRGGAKRDSRSVEMGSWFSSAVRAKGCEHTELFPPKEGKKHLAVFASSEQKPTQAPHPSASSRGACEASRGPIRVLCPALIPAKGSFPDVWVLQMFRSVSCGWGCELRAHFLLWLTADGMGSALLLPLLPYADCRGPGPHHSLVASTGIGCAFKKRGKKGWEGISWKCSHLLRENAP